MKILGWILIVLGVLDFGASVIEMDITGWILGSTLSEYSPVILGVAGAILIGFASKSDAVGELEQAFDSSGVEVILKSVHGTCICYLTETSIIYENTFDHTPQWPLIRQVMWKFHPSGRVETNLDQIESVSKTTNFGIADMGILLNLKDGSKQSFFIRRKLIGEFIEQIGQHLG